MAATFLQLPEALGAVKYGPFHGAITIGSDPAQCSLSLDPNQGVHPVHATLTPQSSGSYVLAPSRPEAGVFLQPKDQAHLWPVRTPVAASAGDVVVFGTPMGPRFTIQREEETSASKGPQAGLGKRTTSEARRQLTARLLSAPGPVREVYHMVHRLRSGSLSNPQTTVAVVFGVIAVMGAGTLTCSGVGYYLMNYVLK